MVIPIYVMALMYMNFYSILYILMILFSGLCISILSFLYLQHIVSYKEEFYLLILFSILGGMLLVVSNHLISFFIGIELMSLPVIGLVQYSFSQKKSLIIALKYVILSSIFSLFILFSIVLIYFICGNLNFSNIKISLLINNYENNNILLFGLGILLISLFFKLSVFPFHFLVPEIYENISSLILIYFTTIIKVSIFGILIKLFFYFPYSHTQILYKIVKYVAVFSIFFGSMCSVFQKDIKKLIGYSSIAHMGYILITLLFINNYNMANEAALIYLINYLISNIGIFSILIIVRNIYNVKISNFNFYKGLFWNKPILAIAMTIFIFSSLGIPITLGFIAKFYIIFLTIYQFDWLIISIILINSGLSIYYYLKVILNLYVYNHVHLNSSIIKYNEYKILEVIIFLFSMLIIFLGIYPKILINIIHVSNTLL
ncbi:proton-conducting transporter membrane subunit [Buchnera aphidicola]|nr:NADH-quinone oxidoreductase subunit N [Buchnera aphidicola (Stegophylla sp.)]